MFVLAGFAVMVKGQIGRSEILKIPRILKILILTKTHAWERGRLAGGAALARGDTLILAFSHKGRRDPLAAIHT